MRFFVLGLVATTCSLAQAPSESAQAPSESPPAFGTTVVLSAGLRGTVYAIPKDTTVLPDFEHDNLERLGEIWTYTLNIPPRRWRAGFPGITDRFEWFAIDYQGRFWISEPGRYTFALLSDDGSRLYIDGIPVIDNDCQHSPDLRVSAVRLEAGLHRIRISYFQGPRDCLALLLAVAGPDRQWRLFDTQTFKAPSNPADWPSETASPVQIVPTSPREASLTMTSLFHQLAETNSSEKSVLDRKLSAGCIGAAVRTCSSEH